MSRTFGYKKCGNDCKSCVRIGNISDFLFGPKLKLTNSIKFFKIDLSSHSDEPLESHVRLDFQKPRLQDDCM